jgi:uncharacterized protein involved in exopolysaccharide biosynthesis
VEIIKSWDLLQQVVLASGLQSLIPAHSSKGASDDDTRVFNATRTLEKSLTVEPVKKTKLIKITYKSTDPGRATSVLQTLTRLYMQKHLDIQRSPGAMDFFQAQTEQYRKGLVDAEQKVAEFGVKSGAVNAQLEKEMTVRKVNDFESDLRQTHAAIAETEQRIATLQNQQASRPERSTTQVRTSDNPLLMQQLQSTLLTQQLKLTEMQSKFAPDYRPLVELQNEIKQTQEALANAQSKPMRDETTDRDTTHEWLTGELAKARAELSTLHAKEEETSKILDSYRKQATDLNQKEIAQQDLVRSAKSAEDNFLLYSRKQEEARISDALDQRRITNVSVVEPPTVPTRPSNSSAVLAVLLGALLAGLISASLALSTDYLDHSFRTPDEVEVFLSVPVLASLPRN